MRHYVCRQWLQKSENRPAFESVNIELTYQSGDPYVAYDLALLTLSCFFFSWLAAVILSTVSC